MLFYRIFNFFLEYMLPHLRKRNFFTLIWTPNDEKAYENCLKYGADGLISDKPTLLKEYLVKKGLYIKE